MCVGQLSPFTILNSLKKVYTPKRCRYSHCHMFSSPIRVFNKNIIGSASYIVREVRSVREREIQRDSERRK